MYLVLKVWDPRIWYCLLGKFLKLQVSTVLQRATIKRNLGFLETDVQVFTINI